jgi:hypothetical protein
LTLLLSTTAFASISSLLPQLLGIKQDVIITYCTFFITFFNAIIFVFGLSVKVEKYGYTIKEWREIDKILSSISLASNDAINLLADVESKIKSIQIGEPIFFEVENVKLLIML